MLPIQILLILIITTKGETYEDMQGAIKKFKLNKVINIQNINIYLLEVGKNKNIKHLKLLEELFDEKNVLMNELDYQENVGLIKIFNKSNHNLLLLSGDILEGAKQNRMIMDSVIINAKNSYKVPVSCVERDRWSYKKNRNFHASNMKISPKIRESKDSLAINNNSHLIQSKIWEDIDNISKEKGLSSPTSNYCGLKKIILMKIKKFESKIDLKNFNAYIVEGVGKVFLNTFFHVMLQKKT